MLFCASAALAQREEFADRIAVTVVEIPVQVFANGKPVVGLPGCARSPALNGADWVLERLAAGIDVTDQDIAAMGVGGLLKEMPDRPHPRRLRK